MCSLFLAATHVSEGSFQWAAYKRDVNKRLKSLSQSTCLKSDHLIIMIPCHQYTSSKVCFVLENVGNLLQPQLWKMMVFIWKQLKWNLVWTNSVQDRVHLPSSSCQIGKEEVLRGKHEGVLHMIISWLLLPAKWRRLSLQEQNFCLRHDKEKPIKLEGKKPL